MLRVLLAALFLGCCSLEACVTYNPQTGTYTVDSQGDISPPSDLVQTTTAQETEQSWGLLPVSP